MKAVEYREKYVKRETISLRRSSVSVFRNYGADSNSNSNEWQVNKISRRSRLTHSLTPRHTSHSANMIEMRKPTPEICVGSENICGILATPFCLLSFTLSASSRLRTEIDREREKKTSRNKRAKARAPAPSLLRIDISRTRPIPTRRENMQIPYIHWIYLYTDSHSIFSFDFRKSARALAAKMNKEKCFIHQE